MSRESQKELTKNKIIESAKELLKTKPLEEISVEEITKNANVAKGSFYVHFTKKEDILSFIACQDIENIYNEIFKMAESSNIIDTIYSYMYKFTKGICDYGTKITISWLKIEIDEGCKCKYNENQLTKLFDFFISKKEIKNRCYDNEIYTILSILYGNITLWCVNDELDLYKIITKDLVITLIEKYLEV